MHRNVTLLCDPILPSFTPVPLVEMADASQPDKSIQVKLVLLGELFMRSNAHRLKHTLGEAAVGKSSVVLRLVRRELTLDSALN